MEIKGMPGYRLTDYILIIGLPQELTEQVRLIKKEFAAGFHAEQANAQPFIIVSAFTTPLLLEEKIRYRLENIARAVVPFKIELRDFGSFPSHTIYLNITSKAPVGNLVKEIKKAQSLLKPDNDHKPYFIDEAHIAICKKLKPWQYEKAWLKFSHLEFTSRFIADKMILLRKTASGFDTVQSFSFLGMEEKVSQGDLFN